MTSLCTRINIPASAPAVSLSHHPLARLVSNDSSLSLGEPSSPDISDTHDEESPLPAQLAPHILLGSIHHASDREVLRKAGVTAVLNVSNQCSNYFSDELLYKQIPVEDSSSASLMPYFKEASEFIGEHLAALLLPTSVLVLTFQLVECRPFSLYCCFTSRCLCIVSWVAFVPSMLNGECYATADCSTNAFLCLIQYVWLNSCSLCSCLWFCRRCGESQRPCSHPLCWRCVSIPNHLHLILCPEGPYDSHRGI